MIYRQGEIVIVPFPFSDLSSVRQRPVLILSKDKDNEKVEDVITCGITSNLKNSGHSVLIDNSDLEEGRIPVRSRIKVDKLFTLDKSTIIKKIGRVNNSIFKGVKREFDSLV